MTFLFSLLLESHNTGFWLGNQWGFCSCKWEDFDLDYIFFCNLIFLVETFRMQKNISFGKGSLSTLVYVFKSSLNYHWLKIMSLISVEICEKETDNVSRIPGGESSWNWTLQQPWGQPPQKSDLPTLSRVHDPKGLRT